MRLKSAQSELKEKEAACKTSDHSYAQDKAKFDALGKEISKLEVLYSWCLFDRASIIFGKSDRRLTFGDFYFGDNLPAVWPRG